MLLRNMGITDWLCNGTLLQVTKFRERATGVRILMGVWRQVEHIFKVTLSSDHDMFPIRILRTRFPVRLAYEYCMKVNKSQGESFDNVGVYLDRDVFSHGQLYFAASRCRTRDGQRFFVENLYHSPSSDPRCIRIVNVVYREVLRAGQSQFETARPAEDAQPLRII